MGRTPGRRQNSDSNCATKIYAGCPHRSVLALIIDWVETYWWEPIGRRDALLVKSGVDYAYPYISRSQGMTGAHRSHMHSNTASLCTMSHCSSSTKDCSLWGLVCPESCIYWLRCRWTVGGGKTACRTLKLQTPHPKITDPAGTPDDKYHGGDKYTHR